MTEQVTDSGSGDLAEDKTGSGAYPELVGSVLAEKYGFNETQTLKDLRQEAIKAFNDGEKDKYLDLFRMYDDLGQQLVEGQNGTDFPYGHLGLMLAVASIRRDTGRWQFYIDDLEDALTFCRGMGYDDAATNVELIITHTQQEMARLGSAE